MRKLTWAVAAAAACAMGLARAERFDYGRLLVEDGPEKGLKVEDNVRWLEAGKVPDYAVPNVIKWLSLKGVDVTRFRERYRPVEPGLGEPLAKRKGFRLGYMLDVSRDKMPTLETLKRMADILAAVGFNEFQLYTECTFAYTGLESAWREWSPMTAAETRELADYCRGKGLLLVPNQNSFGHLEKLFRHKEYRYLAETPDGYTIEHPPLKNRPPCALCPTDERTYGFLDSLYAELLPNFPGATAINVGCDEVWDIFDPKGRSAAKAAKVGVPRVYMDHMLMVHDLLAKRGFRMAFWSDMALYEPALLDEIPKDAIPLQWGYGAEEFDRGYTCEFEGRCLALKRRGLSYYVCPSTRTYGKSFGDWPRMSGNVRLTVAAARRYDAMGLLLTTWGDGGHRAPFLAEIPALVYTAAQVRGEDPSEAEVNARAWDLAKLMPGCVEAGEATRDLLAEIDAAKKDGTLAGKRGGFAARYNELWLRHNRPGGLKASAAEVGLAPELTFGVVSDIHVTTPQSTRLFRKALRYFRLRGADAVMVPGDLTDWGLRSGYRYVAEAWKDVFAGTGTVPLFCTGNHDFDGWRYTDMTMEMHANGYSEDDHITNFGQDKVWEKAFGEPYAPVRVRTVKGYDFVSAEWRGYEELPKWMRENGARFRGGKPFFVFQHPPIKGTTSDSAGWADQGAGYEALKNFPNAIAFTGHAHHPLCDEHSFWRGAFTAIAVPSLSYTCVPSCYENSTGGTAQTMPPIETRRDLRGGEGYFVSVYPDCAVVERLDFDEDGAQAAPAWIVPFGAKPEGPACRTAASEAPRFPAGATIATETRNARNRKGNWAIAMNCEFPAAVAAPGDRVLRYDIRAVPADGSEGGVWKFLNPACVRHPRHDAETMRFWFDVRGLPQDREYVLEAVAYNAFGKPSAPIRSGTLRGTAGLERVKRTCVTLTFDDGLKDRLAPVMPVLERYGFGDRAGVGVATPSCLVADRVDIGGGLTAAAFAERLDGWIGERRRNAEIRFRAIPADFEAMIRALRERKDRDNVEVTDFKTYVNWYGKR